MIPRRPPLTDLLPDPNQPRLADIQARRLHRNRALSLEHTSLAVNDTDSRGGTELQRIRCVKVGALSGGSVSVQISVDGRDVLGSSVASGTTARPHPQWYFPPNSIITSTITNVDGVPTGTAHVTVELEPLIIVPRGEAQPQGKDRLFPSRRAEAERINRTIGVRRPEASLTRSEGLVGYRDRRREPDIRNPEPIKRIDHRFRPRRPR